MTGRSLNVPFLRDGRRDFAATEGIELLRRQVEQVLATECNPDGTGGEMPWRTAFGVPLHLVRHRANTHVLRALVQTWLRDALVRWVPNAELVLVEVTTDATTIVVRAGIRDRRSGAEATASARMAVP